MVSEPRSWVRVTGVSLREGLFGGQQFNSLQPLDIFLARLDFAPNGINPPHTHPRATEVLQVLKGTIYAGFVTSNPNRHFTKILN